MTSTSFREYERRIRQQFTDMFAGSGFDANRDIAGIILNRWGHAYVSPQPDFFFGKDGKAAPRQVLRKVLFDCVAFANTGWGYGSPVFNRRSPASCRSNS